jgi:hypothetical protein
VLWAYLLAELDDFARTGRTQKVEGLRQGREHRLPKTWADELSQILDSYVRADAVQRRAAAQ